MPIYGIMFLHVSTPTRSCMWGKGSEVHGSVWHVLYSTYTQYRDILNYVVTCQICIIRLQQNMRFRLKGIWSYNTRMCQVIMHISWAHSMPVGMLGTSPGDSPCVIMFVCTQQGDWSILVVGWWQYTSICAHLGCVWHFVGLVWVLVNTFNLVLYSGHA